MASVEIYRAQLTREPFLWREMCVTARLLMGGLSLEKICERVFRENLFQYPTEKSLRRMARACVLRLQRLEDAEAVRLIAEAPAVVSQQLCLYALLKDSRLLQDFMLQVIAVKYRQHDLRCSRADVRAFFLQLQAQNEQVAAWSDSTIQKISGVIMSILIQLGYLANRESEELQLVYLQPQVRDIMEQHGDQAWLAMFYTV